MRPVRPEHGMSRSAVRCLMDWVSLPYTTRHGGSVTYHYCSKVNQFGAIFTELDPIEIRQK